MDNFTKEFRLSTIENLYKGHKKDKIYTLLLNGEEVRASLCRYDNLDFYKVRTVNGHEIILSSEHQNLVLGGQVKRTSELTTEDYLPFNLTPYDGGKGLDYEDGLMVGAFLGDGCVKDDYAVTYFVNETTKAGILADIIRIGENRFGANVSMNYIGENCVNVAVTSRMLRGLIDEYVSGKARTKALNPKCINRSLDFRKGILAGLLATEGTAGKNRIYTASENEVETVCAMLASMGIASRIDTDDRRQIEGKLSDNPVYCIRFYTPGDTHIQYRSNVFVKQDGYMWFKIESVTPVTDGSRIGYCFQMEDENDPYFMLPSGLVTHNCRLRLDLRELRRRNGGFFGAGESTGSVGVVTLNLPHLAYEAKDEADFFARLDRLMDVAARSLEIKRSVITKLLDAGLYPYTKAYLGNFNNHFSTIGLVGGNEMCLNAKWLHRDLTDEKAQDFTEKVLNHMRDRLADYQEKYAPTLFNLEATPAESTAYRLAKHDKERYPDIITANEHGTPYYTNSTNLPVGATDDVFDALDIQDRFQPLYTSGTVFHTFLGEKLPSWQSAASLIRTMCANYKLPYISLSPTYSICPKCGYIAGEHFTCPNCGGETEVYSRITGYYRPVKNWNDGKVQEFKDRKEYVVAGSGFRPSGKKPKIMAGTGPEKEPTKEPVTAPKTVTEKKTEAVTENTAEESGTGQAILFTTTSCPNCRAVKPALKAAGIAYTEVNADEDPETAAKCGIQSAPTLVVPGEGTFTGAGAIFGYIKAHGKA